MHSSNDRPVSPTFGTKDVPASNRRTMSASDRRPSHPSRPAATGKPGGSEAPHQTSDPAPVAPEPVRERLVLVVDDETPIVEALFLIIEDAGYTAIGAYDGRSGLEIARQRHPDLIITDMMMPQLDGAGLISSLRDDAQQDDRRAPAIVVMTAGGLRNAEAAGADAVLRKPFDIVDVENLLHHFLRAPASDKRDPGEL